MCVILKHVPGVCNLVNDLYVHSEMQLVWANPGLMACVCDSPFFFLQNVNTECTSGTL